MGRMAEKWEEERLEREQFEKEQADNNWQEILRSDPAFALWLDWMNRHEKERT